jgi:CheY-like chemotaxis protein
MSAARTLAGLRILAVEDEALVAMYLEDLLVDLGCLVVGPAARVETAVHLLETQHVDAAILDVNVAGEKVFPVADRLVRLGVPFLFSTGYGAAGLSSHHMERLVLQKPYSSEKLKAALESALRIDPHAARP